MRYRWYAGWIVAVLIGGCSAPGLSKPDLVNREWTSISSKATIRFENNRVSGSDGCNRYASSYTLSAHHLIISDKMISTMMACEDRRMADADLFRRALRGVTHYRIANNRLTLLGEKEGVLAEFSTHDE